MNVLSGDALELLRPLFIGTRHGAGKTYEGLYVLTWINSLWNGSKLNYDTHHLAAILMIDCCSISYSFRRAYAWKSFSLNDPIG